METPPEIPKRSLLENMRASLEPTADEVMPMRIAKGATRGFLGLVTAPWELAKAAIQPPQTPEEATIQASSPVGQASLFAHRTVGAPAQESFSQAYESWKQGHPIRAGIHGAAGAVPLVGPYADQLITRAESGDIAGALSEGAVSFGLPFAAKGLGRIGLRKPIAKGAAHILEGGPEAMAKTPIGGPVLGEASRGDVARYAQSKGIDLLPAQALESDLLPGMRTGALRSLQSVGERSELFGKDLRSHLAGQKASLLEDVDAFRNQLTRGEQLPDRQSIGGNLKDQTATRMKELKDSATADFDTWTQETGATPIETSAYVDKWKAESNGLRTALRNIPGPRKARIRELLDKASNLGKDVLAKEIPEEITVGGKKMQVSEMTPLLRDLALKNAPIKLVKTFKPEISARDAQFLRSELFDIAHDYTGVWGERANQIASRMLTDVDQMIADTSKEAGTLEIWRGANAKWKLIEERYNRQSSPLYQILKEPNASMVPEKLAMKGAIGGRPESIQLARAAGIDLNPLKSHVVQDIADRGYTLGGRRGSQLGGYSHEYLSELFDPIELGRLYKQGRIARSIDYELNKSGTSNVLNATKEAEAVATAPAKVVTGKFGQLLNSLAAPIASRITMNPTFREAATGLAPLETPVPSTRLRRLSRTVGRARIPAAAIGGEAQNRLLRDMNQR